MMPADIIAEKESPVIVPRSAWLIVLSGARAFVGHGAVITAFSLGCFVVLWQLLSEFVFSPFLIPPPTAVAVAALPMIHSGEYFQDVGISLLRVFVGFVTGSAAAMGSFSSSLS